MQADIHPDVRPVVFQDIVSGAQFKIESAVQTKETVTIDGEEFPLVKVDVSSASHPFYTGNQRIVDTTGRVEKFGTKFGGGSLSGLLKKKKK